MLQLNLIGNLGADAEVKDLNGRRAVCFNVAHTDRWTDENDQKHESTTWVSCIWNGEGGNLLPYLKRGTTVFLSGPISTRVYSSPKERRMVAGLNLRVDHIELVGGKVDDVPSELINDDGLIFRTYKAFYVDNNALQTLNVANKTMTILYDRQGKAYSIEKAGWIRPQQTQEPEPEQQSATEDAGTKNDTVTSTKSTSKKK